MHAWIKFTDQSNYVHECVTVHRQTHTTRNNFSKISRRLLLFGNKLSQKYLNIFRIHLNYHTETFVLTKYFSLKGDTSNRWTFERIPHITFKAIASQINITASLKHNKCHIFQIFLFPKVFICSNSQSKS